MYDSWMEICPQIGWWRPRRRWEKKWAANARQLLFDVSIYKSTARWMVCVPCCHMACECDWVSQSNGPKKNIIIIHAEKKTTVSSERNAKCVSEARLCEFCFLSIWIKIRKKKTFVLGNEKFTKVKYLDQNTHANRPGHIMSNQRRRQRWMVAQWILGIAYKSSTHL